MRNLHIASSIGIISRKVPQTNNFVPTCVHLNSAMKTYTKHDELASAAKSIVEIIEQKVHGTKDYADKPRFAAWKDAVRRVAEVVDSVRNIARITHEIPLTIIAAERFCKWHKRVGWETEGHPFLKWRLITHPDKAYFNDHPWLQTVERRFDLQRTGFQTSAFPPAAQPSSETLLEAAICKGKEKASDAEVKAMIKDDNGEDELVDEDAEMGGDTIDYEHARGWQSTRQGAASGSRQSNHWSRTPKPKLVKHEEVDELDEENHDEDTAMDMPDANNDDDEDYTTGHPQKKPRTSNNAGKLPPQSWSRPVVMIPQGRPVIRLPARSAPNPTQGSRSESDQRSRITTPAAGPSTIAAPRGTDLPNPPSAPMPQRQPSSLFEVNVREELNQLFQFRDTMSVQMLQVKTRLNAVNGHRQAATPGLVEERMRTMADDVAEVTSRQTSTEKKVDKTVRQMADQYVALASRQTLSEQKLDSAIRAIDALRLEVVALAAGRLPPPDDPTSGLIAPPPPSEDGNDAMEGSQHCGDDEMGGLEDDLAVGSMVTQEAQFDQGQSQDVGARNNSGMEGNGRDGQLQPGASRVTATASMIPNIRCEAPPEASQTRSDVAGPTNEGLQLGKSAVYSYHGRTDLEDRPVGMEWQHQSEDVGTLGGYIQGVFSDTECPPSQ
ncbi:hypothetical protein BKA82DRAFT_35255 [Pisolithus tinctorius]|uniref:Uncharacterized protein n=1 Tax=Pisolithus tinctorius Marx 270 TaxID=870435 RepID=A0A0C3NES4_PISTI|nr:hypothetical protein BKA82DRAFT_35255 [Pisolithus tinctorius]KIN94245.1 hypothetical protein M404DRAFT_35255 [Pisolithus tinctorius Marx 270]